jgi:curved DNA-binding protein CbpA
MAPTYYEILNLSPSTLSSAPDPATATAIVKRAYRLALLRHHPDKAKQQQQHHHHHHHLPSSPYHPQPGLVAKPTKEGTFTIDQIAAAYATLSGAAQRAAYDRSLAASTSTGGRSGDGDGAWSAGFQTGIEDVDLDDLACEDGAGERYGDEDRDGKRSGQEDGSGRGGGAAATATMTMTRWYRSCRCGNPRGYHFTEADLEEAADLGELMVGCADCSLWLRVHFAVLEDDDEGNHDSDGDNHGQEEEDGVGRDGWSATSADDGNNER